MKKMLAIILTIILLVSLTSTVYAEDKKWYKSSDGVVEVKFVSFEEKDYPKYTLKLQLRIAGETETATISSTYDLSSWVTSFVKNNPSYKNRKVKVTTDGTFNGFAQKSDTTYEISVKVAVGGKSGYRLTNTIDLSEVFPDDFVNYDIINIATCIEAHVNLLLNSSSYSISNASVIESRKYTDIVYYLYTITAQNRLGGNSSNYIVVFFNKSTGKFASYNLTTNEYVIKGDSGVVWINAINELKDISDESTELSATAIMAKIK